MVAAVLALALGTARLPAQSPPSPNLDYIDALWVAKTDGLRKVESATGTTVYDRTDLLDVRRVAVDDQAGIVWVYGQGTIARYGFDGTLLGTVTVLPPAIPPYALAANVLDGSAWFGGGATLYHYAATGSLLDTVLLLEPLVALAHDRTTDRLWVATLTAVRAYDGAGVEVATLALGAPAVVTALAVDQESGAIWVGLADRVRQYTAAGCWRSTCPSSARSIWRATMPGPSG